MSDQHVPALDDPAAFGTANAAFHEALVAMTGTETLIILYEMVNEVVARAVTTVSPAAGAEEDNGSTATPRRGGRSQGSKETRAGEQVCVSWRHVLAVVVLTKNIKN